MAGSDEECRARRFTGVGRPRLGSDTSILPFYLLAYKFRGASQQNSHFTGIDLRYSLDHFSRLQFRIRLPNLDQEVGAEMEQGLVLVELTTWQQHGLVELWVPGPPLGTAPRPTQFLVTVVRVDGEGEQEFHN